MAIHAARALVMRAVPAGVGSMQRKHVALARRAGRARIERLLTPGMAPGAA
jgi:hypothetical protein